MDQKPLRIFNVNEILAGLPLADLSRGVEQEDDADAFPMQAAFGSGGLFIGGFVGLAPWENHPDTDELLYAVEGEVEITILTDAEHKRKCCGRDASVSYPKDCGIASTPMRRSG